MMKYRLKNGIKRKMKIKSVICPYCKDIIYSRAHYDFRSCSCGKTSIDGGNGDKDNWEYERVVYSSDKVPESIQVEVDTTPQELYDDWNRGRKK